MLITVFFSLVAANDGLNVVYVNSRCPNKTLEMVLTHILNMLEPKNALLSRN